MKDTGTMFKPLSTGHCTERRITREKGQLRDKEGDTGRQGRPELATALMRWRRCPPSDAYLCIMCAAVTNNLIRVLNINPNFEGISYIKRHTMISCGYSSFQKQGWADEQETGKCQHPAHFGYRVHGDT